MPNVKVFLKPWQGKATSMAANGYTILIVKRLYKIH